MARDRDRRHFDVDDGQTRAAKHSSGGRPTIEIPPGLVAWRPKKTGTHTIDIVAYQVTDSILRYPRELQYSRPGKWYGERTFYAHRGVGVNNEWHTCLAKTFNRPCPVCEARAVLNKSPNQEDQKAAYALKPSDRQLFLIYDRDDTDKGVQLWEVSNWNFGRHLDIFIGDARPQKRDAMRRYYHPTEGMTLRVSAVEVAIGTQGQKNTEYRINEMYERESPLPDELFDHGFDLDKMVRALDYKTLKAIYEGSSEGDADDEEVPAHDEIGDETNGRASRSESRPAPRKPDPEPADDKGGDQWASRDLVEFDFGDEVLRGRIVRIDSDKRNASVQVEDRAKPIIVDFDDLRLVEADDTFDLKDPPEEVKKEEAKKEKETPPKKGTSRWEDDEDENPPKPAARAKAAEPPAKGKRR